MNGRRGNARRRGKKNKAPGFQCSEYCLPAFLLVQIKEFDLCASGKGGRAHMHAQCIWKCIFRCTCVYLGCADACTPIRYTNMCVCIPFTCMHMEMHVRICIFMGKCVHHVHDYVHMRVHPYCTRTPTCIHLYGTLIHMHMNMNM